MDGVVWWFAIYMYSVDGVIKWFVLYIYSVVRGVFSRADVCERLKKILWYGIVELSDFYIE